jgi:DNA uptake protein ComE-like DNA-binding protein
VKAEPTATYEAAPAVLTVRLSTADVDDLRDIGMSARQAKRVIRYRDERGLTSVDDLTNVPGFSRSFVDRIRSRISD